MSAISSVTKHCNTCEKTNDEVKLKHCARCKQVYYCNVECQRNDWEAGHNQACKLLEGAQIDKVRVVNIFNGKEPDAFFHFLKEQNNQAYDLGEQGKYEKAMGIATNALRLIDLSLAVKWIYKTPVGLEKIYLAKARLCLCASNIAGFLHLKNERKQFTINGLQALKNEEIGDEANRERELLWLTRLLLEEDEPEKTAQECLRDVEGINGVQRPQVMAYGMLAKAAAESGDYKAAAAAASNGIDALQGTNLEMIESIPALLYKRHVVALVSLGKKDEAEKKVAQYIEILEGAKRECDKLPLAFLLNEQASLAERKFRYDVVEKKALRALEILKGEQGPEVAAIRGNSNRMLNKV